MASLASFGLPLLHYGDEKQQGPLEPATPNTTSTPVASGLQRQSPAAAPQLAAQQQGAQEGATSVVAGVAAEVPAWMSDRLATQEKLVDGLTTAELAQLVRCWLQHRLEAPHYVAAVMERVHEGRCGFTCCQRMLPAPPRNGVSKRRISLSQRRIFEEKAKVFCCTECETMSVKVEAILQENCTSESMEGVRTELPSLDGFKPQQPQQSLIADPCIEGQTQAGTVPLVNGSKPSEAGACKAVAPKPKGILKNKNEALNPDGTIKRTTASRSAKKKTSVALADTVVEREPSLEALADGSRPGMEQIRGEQNAVDGYVPRFKSQTASARPIQSSNAIISSNKADLSDALASQLQLGTPKDSADDVNGDSRRHDAIGNASYVNDVDLNDDDDDDDGDGDDDDDSHDEASDNESEDMEDFIFKPSEGYLAHPLTRMKLSSFSNLYTVLSQWLQIGTDHTDAGGEACGRGTASTIRDRANPSLAKQVMAILVPHVVEVVQHLQIRTPTSQLEHLLGELVCALNLRMGKVPTLHMTEAQLLTAILLQVFYKMLAYETGAVGRSPATKGLAKQDIQDWSAIEARWEAYLLQKLDILGLGLEHYEMIDRELLQPFLEQFREEGM